MLTSTSYGNRSVQSQTLAFRGEFRLSYLRSLGTFNPHIIVTATKAREAQQGSL